VSQSTRLLSKKVLMMKTCFDIFKVRFTGYARLIAVYISNGYQQTKNGQYIIKFAYIACACVASESQDSQIQNISQGQHTLDFMFPSSPAKANGK
jgi:hypothetical protein